MKKQMRQYLGPLCVGAFAFLVGCAGDETGFGVDALGQDSRSLLLHGDVPPLETIAVERWEAAFAGCEGLLGRVQEYGVAEGQPELIVGLDIDRNIVCVDTYASVENELGLRSSDDVDVLWLGYVATLQTLEADRASAEPQTNSGGASEPNSAQPRASRNNNSSSPMAAPLIDLGLVAGDPDPQPNEPVVDVLGYDVDFH